MSEAKMRYVRKAGSIEGIQLAKDNVGQVEQWLQENGQNVTTSIDAHDNPTVWVTPALGKPTPVGAGHWFIKDDSSGELNVLTQEEFEDTYEPEKPEDEAKIEKNHQA